MSVVEALLDQLCVELGFCLPPEARRAIALAPPPGVEAFARRVWEAEGMGSPAPSDPLFVRLCEAVARSPRTGPLRVVWPDGALIARVVVDPKCLPLETSHVVGTFEAGPGFERLAPGLEAVQRARASGQEAAAFEASRDLDDLGVTATDAIGRGYAVFDLVFDEGGLLFCIAPLWTPARSAR